MSGATYATTSTVNEDKIQIDKRVYHLVKCLEITDDCLKYKIKISKNLFEEKLNRLFGPINLDIKELKLDLNDRFENEIIKKRIQAPINLVKNDIIKLINGLKEENKIVDLDKIDTALKNLESSIQSVQMFDGIDKRIDDFLRPIGERYQKYFDQLEREEFLFELNRDNVKNKCEIEQINNDIKLLNIDKSDYKKWLLTPELDTKITNEKDITKSAYYANHNGNIKEDVNNNLLACSLIEDLSYEVINFNEQLDNMDVLTDFELDDDEVIENKAKHYRMCSSVSTASSSSSSSSSLFSDITSKPIDHWLLK